MKIISTINKFGDDYEEWKTNERKKDLEWLSKKIASDLNGDMQNLINSTDSAYNFKLGTRLIYKKHKRHKPYCLLHNWATKKEAVPGEKNNFLLNKTSKGNVGKFMNQFPWKKCKPGVLYIVPEAMVTDERPHDFFLFDVGSGKCMSIEIQDIANHYTQQQQHNDIIKAQYLFFNSPFLQFYPMQISHWQVKFDSEIVVVDQILDWFDQEVTYSNVYNPIDEDVPF